MKFLVIGLGSMGKRRIRCLQRLSAGEVIGFDPRQDRCDEATDKYGITCYTDFPEATATGPDAFVISTPPHLHMTYAREAAQAGKHFFIEASVVDEGFDEVMDLVKGQDIVAAPSCTLRFHPSIKTIKEVLESGDVGKAQAFTHHSGQWLPDWHPWEDYRTFYVSRRDTGACREIVPFELTWLTWLLGDVHQVSGFKDKLSDLECDIDDIYQVLMRMDNGVSGHLLVDVLARAPIRHFRLLCSEGVIEWDIHDKAVRVYKTQTGEWSTIKEPEQTVEKGYSEMSAEGMYVEEIQAFLDAIAGKAPWPHTLEADARILEILYAAERSDDDGVHVQTTH